MAGMGCAADEVRNRAPAGGGVGRPSGLGVRGGRTSGRGWLPALGVGDCAWDPRELWGWGAAVWGHLPFRVGAAPEFGAPWLAGSGPRPRVPEAARRRRWRRKRPATLFVFLGI